MTYYYYSLKPELPDQLYKTCIARIGKTKPIKLASFYFRVTGNDYGQKPVCYNYVGAFLDF